MHVIEIFSDIESTLFAHFFIFFFLENVYHNKKLGK